MTLSATYSPEDNKLRLYSSSRLDAETYQRVRAAGFVWAPKQDLFVAPMWTPGRADLLLELCGDIGDEDTSLVERAEQRAERFDDLSDKRFSDAEQAQKAVHNLTSGIPFGQPILVGHHSEKRARKDAERIENGMRRAVQMWDTAEYWQHRAANALGHAKYKERADVRARRIKKIEADLRKQQRQHAESSKSFSAWNEAELTHERALFIANRNSVSACFSLANYPRDEPVSQYEGRTSLWSALNEGIITADQAKVLALSAHTAAMTWAARWIAHYTLRLTYERAMLGEQGGTVAEKTGPTEGGAVRCWAAPNGGWAWIKKVNKVTVTIADNWGRGGKNFTRNIPFDKLAGVMTAADVAQARTEGRLIETDTGVGFYLRDRTPETDAHAPAAETAAAETMKPDKDAAETVELMRERLREGVQVVVAPLLYLTPASIAEQMIRLADIEPGMHVLEPSAGTGALLDAVRRNTHGVVTTAVELDAQLAARLRMHCDDVRQADFLQCGQELGKFHRVLMNPPFNGGCDIAHIKHAYSMLKPGGVLVAICADGPRQNAQLRPLAVSTGGCWETLPAGSFLPAQTNVNTALLVMRAP